MVPTEEVVEVRRGGESPDRAQVLPGLRAGEMDLTDDTWHLIKNTAKVTASWAAAAVASRCRSRKSEAGRILRQVQEGVERPKPAVSFEIASRSRWPTAPLPLSTARSRMWTRNGHA